MPNITSVQPRSLHYIPPLPLSSSSPLPHNILHLKPPSLLIYVHALLLPYFYKPFEYTICFFFFLFPAKGNDFCDPLYSTRARVCISTCHYHILNCIFSCKICIHQYTTVIKKCLAQFSLSLCLIIFSSKHENTKV